MIKSFKDFDNELDGQKIYEAFDDIRDNDENIFTEKDVYVPELISDNKFLLKISRIVLRKLNSANLGEFSVYPMIININDVPGVYIYNQENPSMNIIVCRNINGKQIYLFKKFDLGGDNGAENVADLVLTTTKFGFTDMIKIIISKLQNNSDAIEEGIIYEWFEGGTYQYDETMVSKCAAMSADVRQALFDLLKTPKKQPKYNAIYGEIWDGYTNGEEPYVKICNEIEDVVGSGKKLTRTGYFKNVLNVFYNAAFGYTDHSEEMDPLFYDTSYTPIWDEGSGISSKTEVHTTVEDGEAEARKTKYEAQLAENIKEYENDMEEIYEIALAMCTYVKKGGNLTDDERSALPARGLLITGVGGIGKSASIKKALKKMNMRADVDYHIASSGSTAAQELYSKFYEFNGKIIIFDDSGSLFDGDYKPSLWKKAFEANIDDALIAYPKMTSRSGESNVYEPSKKTRQERYFLEIGHGTPKEEKEFKNNILMELEKDYRDETGFSGRYLPKGIEAEHKRIADKEWAIKQEEKTPKMPKRFNYKGLVIIISNKPRKDFKAEVGVDSWQAITSRFTCFDLHPMPETIWGAIKKSILKQRDLPESVLSDKECLIPRDMVDEFIKEVELNFEDPQYRLMNYRLVADIMHHQLLGEPGRKRWKDRLRRAMDTKQ